MRRRSISLIPVAGFVAALSVAGSGFAQNSDFNLSAHANSHATAKQIGLPEYPGATPYKDKDSDSSSADLGFELNSFHFSVQVASYVTTDSPEQVLAFYRKPLAKYGEVLECDHGKPVGALTVTKSGLTCGDQHGGKVSVNGTGDSDHELRAGSPERYRIVGVDTTEAGKTKFGLVALVLPKDS
ncbi:MAG TPA: hypothetical protein VMD92_15765 [Acidobacteriaceae bacterium]|jgi:hypothetical protein|nr:hypothetical protein [Acidobacteriaceae bacterium]